MGKNFSCNNVEGKRRKSDFYETPYSLTRQLLQHCSLPTNGEVLEPACGNGAISKVLTESGFSVTSTDISSGVDFLSENYSGRRPRLIITNPPFSLAMEFILKAKRTADSAIAMLLPLSYLHGKKRFDSIYQDREYPLTEVYVFTRYPMLGDPLREDGKYRTGMMVYAWYVWRKNATVGAPTIHWIDNNEFVLNSRST